MTQATLPDAATRAQIGAADPSGSVWLAANAGSGKTRVLTNRVAWLLLQGTPPERILCLTYTKAAAGEMQNRLFKTLGGWAMMPDPDLRDELRTLGVPFDRISTEQMRHARTLFARAIETPGGLKIQTIHAFCASLLRRFPLEAGVSPAFSEMDDTATTRLHADILDAMADDPDEAPLVDAMSARLSDGEPSKFLAQVARAWPVGTAPMDEAALRDALGVGNDTEANLREGTITANDVSLVNVVREAAAGDKGVKMVRLHRSLSEAYVADYDDRFDILCAALLTKEKQPLKALVSKGVATTLGDDCVDELRDLAERLSDAVARLGALASLDYALALHAFAPAFTRRLQAAKQARGWLDFDDQIARARHLLSTSDMAQWVLFKLDGGLDHILVDEAQDTAPAQWDVIAALAAEFGAGSGAREDVVRTLFVVGDRKQSIYSFQGADPDAFDRMRDVFADRLPQQAAALRDHALLHSFRSSTVILDLVDAVFADGGGVGPAPQHLAHNPDLPGRVDLWHPIEQEKADTDDRKWFDPIDRPAANDAEVLLARRIADNLRAMIDAGTPIVHKGTRRPVTEGDILILLQRRKSLFHHVIRECKARDLNLAGADRLKLSDDLAVRDLIALLTWAATPDDDLSLAVVLRSPLVGLDEGALFDIAHGRRKRPLWSVLRDSGHDIAMLEDILRIADILRPYEILERVLIRHGGRRRLIARLGTEREEAIEALLGQALAYETLEVPSLTGFLGWLASADVDVKRQPGSGSIRVMSVHGSKGLESPVVILPETQVRSPQGISGVRRLLDGTPVWMPNKAGWAPALHDLSEAESVAQAAERDRLLYVALTRAESWLIVGAAGKVGDDPHDSWWRQIEAGMIARGAQPIRNADGAVDLRLQAGDWTPLGKPQRDDDTGVRDAVLPKWVSQRVETPKTAVKPIAPSALPGAKTLAGSDAAPDAMDRGTAIHLLLEHLPSVPEAERAAAARQIAPDADEAALNEALALLSDPALSTVFAAGTLAEVGFVLPASGSAPAVSGTIDRIILSPGRVRVIDFKSNAVVPEAASHTPAGILAQMGAYRAAAGAIWPERTIDLAILWTRTGTLMTIPPDLAAQAWAAVGPLTPPDAIPS
ncbi:double-strand break repair helicase AddA [Jannaschia sp. 2305UL9-9]|uniref:double-strand break repair helicase AddA n=1 Tax=Jannaschia sp. 2305UL9-9 TaxID=3121638 RepID=UPI003527FA5A